MGMHAQDRILKQLFPTTVIEAKPVPCRPRVGALTGALVALLLACPVSAEVEPGGFTDPVFGTFTKVFRGAEGAVVSVRAVQGGSTGIGDRFRDVGESEGSAETAFNVVRFSLSLPFYVAQSALSFVLDPISGTSSEQGLGSGFVIDSSGLVLTNHHVVADADRIDLRFADDRVLRATLVASDPELDVALLRLPDADGGEGYDSVPLGLSSGLHAGEWVMAMGSPFGQEQTVTVGVVSAPSRKLGDGPFDEFIQVDTTVDPQSSGGPLFDREGQVVGINTTAVQGTSSAGYAIPIQAVGAVLADLREGRTPRRGQIGIKVEEADPAEFARFDLKKAPGLWIRTVYEGSAAERAGVKEGDLLVMLAHRTTRRQSDYTLARRDLIDGRMTTIAVWRDGQVQSLAITPIAKAKN